jgi:general secretion pathway protein G
MKRHGLRFAEPVLVLLPGFLDSRPGRRLRGLRGSTLIELLISCSILLVLATVALPLTRFVLIRHREEELRYDLRQMRDAIDRYQDDALAGKFRSPGGTEDYPLDLQTLVDGVETIRAENDRLRYLRKIPIDPMTGDTNWGLRSAQDDPDSTSWGGQDVFDVYSRSTAMALDGTKYSDW